MLGASAGKQLADKYIEESSVVELPGGLTGLRVQQLSGSPTNVYVATAYVAMPYIGMAYT